MIPSHPGRTGEDDPVRAQIDAVLGWRRSHAQVDYAAGDQQRQRLNALLADHAARSNLPAPVHAVLAHPDSRVLDELEQLLRGDQVASVERVPNPPACIPREAGLLFFQAVEEQSAQRLLREAQCDVPTALLAVQMVPALNGLDLLQAGARAVFSDRVPLPDVAQALLTCLNTADRTVLLL